MNKYLMSFKAVVETDAPKFYFTSDAHKAAYNEYNGYKLAYDVFSNSFDKLSKSEKADQRKEYNKLKDSVDKAYNRFMAFPPVVHSEMYACYTLLKSYVNVLEESQRERAEIVEKLSDRSAYEELSWNLDKLIEAESTVDLMIKVLTDISQLNKIDLGSVLSIADKYIADIRRKVYERMANLGCRSSSQSRNLIEDLDVAALGKMIDKSGFTTPSYALTFEEFRIRSTEDPLEDDTADYQVTLTIEK